MPTPSPNAAITHVVFDFDGTCTEIPAIEAAYLAEMRRIFAAEVSSVFDESRWTSACARVRAASPRAGWRIAGAPSAPAAADPYILAFEAAQLIVAEEKIGKPTPADAHHRAVDVAQARLRASLAGLLAALHGRGIRIAFVSNTSTGAIKHRLDDLLRNAADGVRDAVDVFGDARKFVIDEVAWSQSLAPQSVVTSALRARFDALPVSDGAADGRPVYVRRGRYFEALAKVWQGNAALVESTLVVGDVWELDLAMPAALGCSVHLIEREAPFVTYGYERDAVARLGPHGAVSRDLDAVLARV